MYLLNPWDKDDEFKQTCQISSTRLNQGFPDVQLFGAAISLHIDGFWGGGDVVFNTTPYLMTAYYFKAVFSMLVTAGKNQPIRVRQGKRKTTRRWSLVMHHL